MCDPFELFKEETLFVSEQNLPRANVDEKLHGVDDVQSGFERLAEDEAEDELEHGGKNPNSGRRCCHLFDCRELSLTELGLDRDIFCTGEIFLSKVSTSKISSGLRILILTCQGQ